VDKPQGPVGPRSRPQHGLGRAWVSWPVGPQVAVSSSAEVRHHSRHQLDRLSQVGSCIPRPDANALRRGRNAWAASGLRRSGSSGHLGAASAGGRGKEKGAGIRTELGLRSLSAHRRSTRGRRENLADILGFGSLSIWRAVCNPQGCGGSPRSGIAFRSVAKLGRFGSWKSVSRAVGPAGRRSRSDWARVIAKAGPVPARGTECGE